MSDTITLNTNISDVLAALNDAQAALVRATENLVAHDDNEDAHPALRERLTNLEESDNIYTKDEIEDLVRDGIKTHSDQSFKTAHTEWDEYEQGLTSTINRIDSDIETLKQKTSGDSEDEEAKADLAYKIKQIEDKYAVQLDSLQRAYREAVAQGQDDLAEMYKNNIEQTLDAKNAEIIAVIKEWEDAGGSSSPDEGIVPSINTQIAEIRQSVAALEDRITQLATLSSAVSENAANIADLQTGLSENNLADEQTRAQVAENRQLIDQNTEADAATKTKVDANRTMINTNTANDEALRARVDALGATPYEGDVYGEDETEDETGNDDEG